MDALFTTWLYIFSSFLQADAAILSLGAVFIIHRLQALDSAFQNAFRMTQAASPAVDVGAAAISIIIGNKERKAQVLEKQQKSAHEFYKYLQALNDIPQEIVKIKKMYKMPTILLVVHLCLSAIALGVTPLLKQWAMVAVGGSMVLLFIITIIFTARLSWGIVLSGSEY